MPQLGRFDKLLIDPPRDGAIELVKSIGSDGAGNAPRRIVYVSCNPATLARDAQVLVQIHGYTLKAAGVMNMFPHTSHVESIAVFDETMKRYTDLVADALTRVKEIQPWDLSKQLAAGKRTRAARRARAGRIRRAAYPRRDQRAARRAGTILRMGFRRDRAVAGRRPRTGYRGDLPFRLPLRARRGRDAADGLYQRGLAQDRGARLERLRAAAGGCCRQSGGCRCCGRAAWAAPAARSSAIRKDPDRAACHYNIHAQFERHIYREASAESPGNTRRGYNHHQHDLRIACTRIDE